MATASRKKKKKASAVKQAAFRPEANPLCLEMTPRARAAAIRAAKKGARLAKGGTTVVNFKCPLDLLDAIDACVWSLRSRDPMAKRSTVIRLALVAYVEAQGVRR